MPLGQCADQAVEVERCYAAPPGGDQLKCSKVVDAYVPRVEGFRFDKVSYCIFPSTRAAYMRIF